MVPLLISTDRQIGFVSIDNTDVASLILLNPNCIFLELLDCRDEPFLSIQDNFRSFVSIKVHAFLGFKNLGDVVKKGGK